MNKPIYEHDCAYCVYMGTVYDEQEQKYVDCYCHYLPIKPWRANIVVRYGPEAENYCSSLDWARRRYQLKDGSPEAWTFGQALALGWVEEN